MFQSPVASEGLLISRRSIARIIGTRGANSTSSLGNRKISSRGYSRRDVNKFPPASKTKHLGRKRTHRTQRDGRRFSLSSGEPQSKRDSRQRNDWQRNEDNALALIPLPNIPLPTSHSPDPFPNTPAPALPPARRISPRPRRRAGLTTKHTNYTKDRHQKQTGMPSVPHFVCSVCFVVKESVITLCLSAHSSSLPLALL